MKQLLIERKQGETRDVLRVQDCPSGEVLLHVGYLGVGERWNGIFLSKNQAGRLASWLSEWAEVQKGA